MGRFHPPLACGLTKKPGLIRVKDFYFSISEGTAGQDGQYWNPDPRPPQFQQQPIPPPIQQQPITRPPNVRKY